MEEPNNVIAEATEEQPEASPQSQSLRHSHGPNFGRFVEGCAKCESEPERYARKGQPRIKPKRIPRTEEGLPADTATPGVYLTYDQLQDLLAQKAQGLGVEDLVAANEALVRALRAPDPETVQAKEDAAKRRQQQRERAIEAAKAQEEGKRMREEACEAAGHKKDEGRSTKSAVVQGQVYNDGFMYPFCLTCGKQFKPIKATMEQMTSAV